MTMTTCDSHHPKTHTKPTQAHVNRCEWVQPSQQSPSVWASNASALATCFLFTKSVLSLYLLYLGSSLFSHHSGIHMYPSALCPSHLYYLHLDFWSPDPLIPDPGLVNTYSSIVSLSYCTWQLTHLPGHHLALPSLYISCRYFTVVL